MQVKKFEAPTLNDALEAVKRELGPEAIILQTKQNRRGFGLMSKGSVEVTAAVSERSLEKKAKVEKKLPDPYLKKIGDLSAEKQADIYENYLAKKVEKDQVSIRNSTGSKNKSVPAQEITKKVTAVRYADIDEHEVKEKFESHSSNSSTIGNLPDQVSKAVDRFAHQKQTTDIALIEEVTMLRKMVDDLRRDRNKPEFLDSDSPYAATDALAHIYEVLLEGYVDRRLAVKMMREAVRSLSTDQRADHDRVLDAVAQQLLQEMRTVPFFPLSISASGAGNAMVHAFIGASGSGKTATLAKLATHAVRERRERVAIIRLQTSSIEESTDPLIVFAKALHLPYRCVKSGDELQLALQDFSLVDYVFVDTPGFSARDAEGVNRIGILLKSVPRLKKHFVAPSTTRMLELHAQAKAAHSIGMDSIIFTKLDESISFGVMASLAHRLQVPMSVFSTGKRVTQDWEEATAERLTASILNIV